MNNSKYYVVGRPMRTTKTGNLLDSAINGGGWTEEEAIADAALWGGAGKKLPLYEISAEDGEKVEADGDFAILCEARDKAFVELRGVENPVYGRKLKTIKIPADNGNE